MPSAFGYESRAESYEQDDYNGYDDYDLAHRRPRGPMTPISVGISGSLSVEQTPDQSIDEAGVLTSSVYHECDSEDDFANSTWESPENVLVVHEDVNEIGSNTEDAFSDWLQSYPESGPTEAAVDSVSFCGSDSAPFSPGCGDYDGIPQRPRRPMVPIAISCRDSPDISSPYQPTNGISALSNPCRLAQPSSPVAPNILVHEMVPITSYSSDLPSTTSVLSQPAGSLSSPATQFAHKVGTDSAIAVLTSESLASVSEVRDSEVTDVAEVFTGGAGERPFATWSSSESLEFDTGEDSKESYSAVHSDPVLAESDSNDKCRVLAARASSRVRKAADSMRGESDICSGPLFFSSPSLPHVSTLSSRDPQPSSLLESPSSSLVSVTSLSVLPSAFSVSSSSLFVPSSSLSSSRSSLFSTPASDVSVHDQVPFPPSISLFSFPSALPLPSVSPSVYDPSPISGSVPVFLPCVSISDVFLSSSHSAEVCADSSVVHVHHFDAVQPSPIDRPPEDPPPDIADELKDWFQAYMGLGIAEPTLLSASGPLPTSTDSSDFPDFLAPTDEFAVDPLPFSNVVENSSFRSHDSCNTFLAPRSDDERDFRSLDPLSSARLSSTSPDDSRLTPGYVGDSSSPATGLEVDTLSPCLQELRDVVHGSRSDSVLPSRVNTLDSSLQSGFAQPLHNAPIFDEAPNFATCTPTGVVWLADPSPADEYNVWSEPEPPDPLCASH